MNGVRKKKGFTIIEVLLALALIALVAGLFAANFDALLTSLEERRPEKVLYDTIREARYQALQQHEPMRLKFDKEAEALVVFKEGEEKAVYKVDIGDRFEVGFDVIGSAQMARGAFRSSSMRGGNGEDEVVFYPDGSSTPVLISLTEEGETVKLKLDPLSCGIRVVGE